MSRRVATIPGGSGGTGGVKIFPAVTHSNPPHTEYDPEGVSLRYVNATVGDDVLLFDYARGELRDSYFVRSTVANIEIYPYNENTYAINDISKYTSGGSSQAGSGTIRRNGGSGVSLQYDENTYTINDITKYTSSGFSQAGSVTIRCNGVSGVSLYDTANAAVQGDDDGTTPMPVDDDIPSGYTVIRTANSVSESTVKGWRVGNRTSSLRCTCTLGTVL